MPDRAIRNLNTRQVLTVKTQTELEKTEKLALLKQKLEILNQNSSLIHVPTRQFETRTQ